MKIIFLVTAIFLFILKPAFGFQMFYPSSSEVRRLEVLYAGEGFIFPTASFPISKKEMLRYADRLIKIADSKDTVHKTQLLIEQLNYSAGKAQMGARATFVYEHYFRTDPVWNTEDSSMDFYRTFIARPGVIDLTLFAGDDDAGGMVIQGVVHRQYNPAKPVFADSNLFTIDDNIPIKADETHFNLKSYFSYHMKDLEILIGRTPIHFGSGRFSTFLPSKRLPYLDLFHYTFHLGPLKMTSYAATLENRTTYEERSYGTIVALADSKRTLTWGDDKKEMGVNFGETIILSAMHRFEYSTRRWRAGLSGHQIVARPDNALHLGDFFPVFSWHNADVGSHNLSVTADLSVSIIPGFEFFFMAGFSDVNAEELFGFPDAEIPTIDAYILGIGYDGHINTPWNTLNFTTMAEYGTTHYLWGNFYNDDLGGHNRNFSKGNYLGRAIYRYSRYDGVNVLMPLTSPYGPGSRWFHFSAGIDSCGPIHIKLNAEWISKLQEVDLITTPYKRNDELKNNPRVTVFGIGPSIELTPTPRTVFYLETAYRGFDKSNWFEFTVGGKINLLFIRPFIWN